LIGSTLTGITDYYDTTALPGTLYYYWVRGKTTWGSSGFSNSLQGNLATGAPLTLANGAAVTVSGDVGTTKRYQISVPAGQSLLEINAKAGTGDCDLSVTKLSPPLPGEPPYLKYGVHVTNNETINIDNPQADTYIISLYANTAYSGLTLTAKYYLAMPLPPTAVNAGDGTSDSAIIVSWNASAGAMSYEVWRSATANSSLAVNIADVSDISYIDVPNPTSNPLSVTATYYYFIKAKNAGGTSAFSANNSGYLARIPAAPTTVTATKNTYFEKIIVSWPAVAGATSYLIYRNTTGVFNELDQIGEVGYVSNYTTYTYEDYGDVDPEPNTNVPNQKYYYWVKSKNGSGALNYKGDYGTIRHSGPASITASQGTLAEKIRISWSSVGPEMTVSYNLYCDNVLVVPAISVTWYEYPVGSVDTGTHEFKVEASFNAYYVSDFSPTCTGYAQNAAILPPAPTLKSVSNGEGNYVEIKWAEVPLALTYNLYRKINAGAPWDVAIMTNIQGPGATISASDITGDVGQKYLYAVTAVNDIGEGPMSAAMTGYAAGPSMEFLKGDTPITLGGLYKSETFFKIFVQPGCSRLVITLAPGGTPSGNCDMYTKLGSYPTLTSYNARGVEGTPVGGESITILNPAAGMWYIMLYGATAYNDFDFSATYYSATDIILTEVPANDQPAPFTAAFKGKVQDETLKGIAGLTVGVRNPSTGLTYWIPTKTDANGIFSYSIPVSAEGVYTFDFTLGAIPDYATTVASYTIKTKRSPTDIFDFVGYIPSETVTLDPTIAMQDYMNLRGGFTNIPPFIDIPTYEYLWILHSLSFTSMDPNITAKLDSGLYMLYYGPEGVAVGNCGNEVSPENLGYKPSPLMVHVAQDRQTEALNGLKGNGLIDNDLANTVEEGGIGVVVIAGVSNPWGDTGLDFDYDISLNADEQIELLENAAGLNPGTVTVQGTYKYDAVIGRELHIRLDGGDREIGVRSSSFFEQLPLP
ncbi:MAG: pre-peptidase C-terminal domain-containing protein, partial [Victivallales bacterium]